MGIFFKSDGLQGYNLGGSSNVYQRSFSTAYDFSSSSADSFTSSLYGNDGSYSDSIFISSAGTTLYIVYTDYTGTTNAGYMKSYTLATAWDLSSLSNPTTPTTITFPLGTEFNVYSGNSAIQRWSGLEWADDGLSFHVLRFERSAMSGSASSVTFKCEYAVSTAWLLSASSLSSTTKIDYATTSSGYGGQCLGLHEMSGGELILSMDENFIELSSISDTTANSISALAGGGGFVFSTDETLLLQNSAYSCGIVHTEITTNYTSGVAVTSVPSSTVQPVKFDVCSTAFTQTYYHDGANSTPVVNDTCYSDDPGTVTLAAGKYRMGTALVSSQVTCDSSGVVTAAVNCIV
jgi:hypothetical protein